MSIKTFKINKFYVLVCGLFVIIDFGTVIVFPYSTFFWKSWSMFFGCFTSAVFLIFLFSRFTLSDNFVEEKIITTKKIRLSEIDCVIYKKLFQDCTICLKNGRRHKIVFQFNNFDLEYFFNYLEKNGIEVIKRH